MIKVIKLNDRVLYGVIPYIADENGNKIWNIPNNEINLKTALKDTIDWYTSRYINKKMNEIDENLSDLSTEITDIEAKFLILIPDITTDEIKKKVALFILGQYTEQQAIEELQEKGLSEEQIAEVMQLLARAVEIGKIIAWKESIWKKEGELEKEIESKSLEELLELDVEKLCIEAYKEIPLEV